MEEKGQILDIHDVALHPQYEQQAYQDIAVVTLKTSNCKFDSKFPIIPKDIIMNLIHEKRMLNANRVKFQ